MIKRKEEIGRLDRLLHTFDKLNRHQQDCGPVVIFQEANWMSIVISESIASMKRDGRNFSDRVFFRDNVIDVDIA